MSRLQGTVKFFSDVKSFGFIAPDRGGPEVFVHRADLNNAVISLVEGQRVAFDLVDSMSKKGNGKKAANVELI